MTKTAESVVRLVRIGTSLLKTEKRVIGPRSSLRVQQRFVARRRSSCGTMTPMALIDPGKRAPAFNLNDQDGKAHRLSDYAGRPVVLYFYPKDDTPGCTKETCAFRDNLPKFKAGKAAVLGASILDEASKAKFADKYDVTFPLLADAEHEVA